ncbi:hypothetical protein GXB81_14210 [Paraburkholderia sp. Ac-20336]|uniref:hypothetical protein n=1 Tax=Burkholderiaceae TaxID=119060 RepID=UPI00141FBA7D|nr:MULTISPECIES: hypothetical protein [Burkholderiaceae]MBN3804195.1 hypothetical protein [Paraburkholderia sp. Ac-20336]MBN3845317.1 hypothetical protein [Paraburkholderia sp. Ac-20342]NIF50748.1 hypothetical protein [Burkholderia sp. Ax-1724]NIF76584.1 hypothetical protein [Paraburkholderia sp. Cy-641]
MRKKADGRLILLRTLINRWGPPLIVMGTVLGMYHAVVDHFYGGRISLLQEQVALLKQQNESLMQSNTELHHTQCDVQYSQIDSARKLADMRMAQLTSSIQLVGGGAVNPDDVAYRYMCLRLKR